MSIKIIPPKLAKKDLLALYDITHPTLRIWFRQSGLAHFVGRRRFTAEEVVQIFQALGRPRLARTAAQRLKDVYARFKGLLSDEIRFKRKYNQAMPPQRQDQLPDTEEECDAAPIHQLENTSEKNPIHLQDALVRLTITAIYIKGQKARKRQAQAQSDCTIAQQRKNELTVVEKAPPKLRRVAL